MQGSSENVPWSPTSSIEQKALGIVYELNKFHQYHVPVITDDKHLVTTFGPTCTSSLSSMAASHIQRWALTLSGYYYTIQYKLMAQHGNVDALSRLPQATDIDAQCLE